MVQFRVALIVMLAGCGSPSSDPSGPSDLDAGTVPVADRAPDSVIVRFRPVATFATTARVAAVARVDGSLADANRDGVSDRFANLANGELAVIELPKGASLDDALSKLRDDPAIQYAEPNYIVHAIATPNDPQFPSLYGLHNTGQTGGVADADIDAVEAWDTTVGSANVVVGVIDTGIDYNHPDLAGNMWVNPNEIANNGVDDDGNGVIDDVHGYNAINGTGNPFDDHYHGTHCAGTIGAVGDNGIGVAGVNWETSLMAIKFLSSGGSGTTADAIASVNYAVGMRNAGVNLRVLSNSWGGGGFSQGLADAIAAANTAGILFVAAAGNSGTNNDFSPHYPSSYDIPNVVAVAATDASDNLASFSCFGPTSVDLGAPGVAVVSTAPNNMYRTLSGTSMATPHVSGVAALALARNDTLTVAELKDLLLNTGDAIPALAGRTVSGKRLNAAAVLDEIGPPVPHFKLAATPPAQTITQEQSATFAIDITAVAGFSGDVTLTASAVPTLDATLTLTPDVVTTPGTATLTVATTQATAATTYEITITGTSGTLVKTRTVSLRVRQFGLAEFTFPSTDTPKPLPDVTTTTSTLRIAAQQGVRMEELRVDLDLRHTWIGDLRITLTSPEGTIVTLHDRSGGSADDIHQTYSFPTQFLDEQAAGDWVLTVADLAGGDSGTLDNWVLRIVGFAEPAETNPPTVAIAAPADGATIANTVTVAIDATDDSVVGRVELYVDGVLYAADTAAPFSVAWNSRSVTNGAHALHAKAYDAVGNSAQSAAITVTTDNDFTPPTAIVTAPADGATVAGDVAITADASDNVGVSRVDFYVDGSFRGSDSGAPFTFTWNSRTVIDGVHTISVRATDTSGNTGAQSPTISVTTDNDLEPPTVAITAPADGATVSGTTAITANATDDIGVTKVEFYVDGVLKATDTSSPYSYSWPTLSHANGNHALYAKAFDAVGNVTQSAAVAVVTDNDFVPPTSTVTSPADGATVGGTVTIAADAVDDRVGVYRVEFYVDGSYRGSDYTAPYTLAWNSATVIDGIHSIHVIAYDQNFNSAPSPTIHVTTDNDLAQPTVSITSPADGATVGGTVTITASAADDIGVTRVEFYVDDVLRSTDTFAPYNYAWPSHTVLNGSHALTARAYDAVGNVTESAAVTVTTDNDQTAPAVAIIAPTGGATVSGMTTIAADASDNVGVTRVDFYVDDVLVGTDTTAPYTFAWDTVTASNASHTLVAKALDALGNIGTSATVTVTAANAGNATFDPARLAPACATVGSSCDTRTLIDGRGPFEQNASNTINASCADGTAGSYHASESLDRLRVFTADAGPLATNKTVTIEATVWKNSTSDRLDLYYTTTPNAPSWTLITTRSASSGNGIKTLSAPFTLPASSLVAIRGVWRFSGSASPCGSGSSNDRDDLVFAVDTTPDTTPPTTSITSPTTGATVSGTVAVSATASDSIGISLVELYVDGTQLASDATPPYSFSWNTSLVPDGSHTLVSRAIDPAGNAADSAPVTVTLANNDTTAPITSITSPASGATVINTITVSASASDNLAVSSVELLIDGSVVATDTAAPYSFSWNTRSVGNGSHSLVSRARDIAGNMGTSLPVVVTVNNDVEPPATSITSPADGAIVAGAITVSAQATDNVAVASVQLYIDGALFATDSVAPYTFAWNTAATTNGSHALRTRATDTSGHVTDSATITVVVDNDFEPPTTAITSPAPDSLVTDVVMVTASATDNRGINSVVLYVNGVPALTDLAPPYAFAWDTSGLPDSFHALRTRATDTSGNYTDGPTIFVHTDNTAPTTAVSSPANGAIVGGTVTISAAASDNRGIARVEILVDGVEIAEDATAPYTAAWNTTTGPTGSHTITSRAVDEAGIVTTSDPVTVTVVNGIALAAYDSTLRAPTCAAYASGCDTSTLINGRDGKGPEPNQPNTINNSCADGTSGTYHVDESLDKLRVFTPDSSPLAAGKTVTVEATIWNRTNLVDSDALDLYYTSNPSSPVWVFIGTAVPASGNGVRVVTRSFTLPAAANVAVRGNLRRRALGGGSASPCTAGNFNDHDDVVFAVAP